MAQLPTNHRLPSGSETEGERDRAALFLGRPVSRLQCSGAFLCLYRKLSAAGGGCGADARWREQDIGIVGGGRSDYRMSSGRSAHYCCRRIRCSGQERRTLTRAIIDGRICGAMSTDHCDDPYGWAAAPLYLELREAAAMIGTSRMWFRIRNDRPAVEHTCACHRPDRRVARGWKRI